MKYNKTLQPKIPITVKYRKNETNVLCDFNLQNRF